MPLAVPSQWRERKLVSWHTFETETEALQAALPPFLIRRPAMSLLPIRPPATTPLATDQLPTLGEAGILRRESPCLANAPEAAFVPLCRSLSRSDGRLNESGRLDLNQRPLGPQPSALPDCATPRGSADDSHSATAAERATGLEPAPRAWKALVQPLHHAREEADYRSAPDLLRALQARRRAGEPGFEPGFTVLETVRIAINSLPREAAAHARPNAGGGTRTPTGRSPPGPKPGAYSNSATPARAGF